MQGVHERWQHFYIFWALKTDNISPNEFSNKSITQRSTVIYWLSSSFCSSLCSSPWLSSSSSVSPLSSSEFLTSSTCLLPEGWFEAGEALDWNLYFLNCAKWKGGTWARGVSGFSEKKEIGMVPLADRVANSGDSILPLKNKIIVQNLHFELKRSFAFIILVLSSKNWILSGNYQQKDSC